MNPVDPDQTISLNGTDVKIKDIPDQSTRAMFGYGHDMLTVKHSGREVVEVEGRKWPYNPETCLIAADTEGEWVKNEQYLVCPGCGLDGT